MKAKMDSHMDSHSSDDEVDYAVFGRMQKKQHWKMLYEISQVVPPLVKEVHRLWRDIPIKSDSSRGDSNHTFITYDKEWFAICILHDEYVKRLHQLKTDLKRLNQS